MARALAADPPVLLMDEPFSAVDPVVRKVLQDELLRIQDELGKTIVFVTHDIDEAIKLGTMVAVLREGGHLAQYAPPAELSDLADAFVEDFLGADRGIRAVVFPSAGLTLTTDPVIRADATAEQIAAPDAPWLLVTDTDGRPLGWSAPQDLAAGDIRPDQLLSYGRPFVPGTDSLAGRPRLRRALPDRLGRRRGRRRTGDRKRAAQQTIGEAIRSAHEARRDDEKVAG
ncbi:proline/glycine betaine ABC transporter ATP-binding protein [Streptomyces purpurascens]